MTPEHVSELQNILRFLRANAFEKSEAALVEEVEVLMRAAQLEKDDAERRQASASGNDDGADSSLNGEDLRSARTVSNDAFGPMSPPAVSRPSLGRFGSNVEQAHAAMALEDAFANEAAEDDNLTIARLEEDAESVGTLDTFATPVGGDDERMSVSISASAFENNDDDSASVSDDDDDEDANDVSFANGATMSPDVALASKSALSSDTPRESAGNDDDVHRNDAERKSAIAKAKGAERDFETTELLFLGREDSEAQRLLQRAWQTAPNEEYADFEDPGYVRARWPFEDEERLFKNVPGTTLTSVETPSRVVSHGSDETKADLGAFTTEDVVKGSFSAREKEGFFSENDDVDDDVDSAAGGFAFDRSPMAVSPVGTATPASERSETLLGDHGSDVTNVRLGWGGSEFGGDGSELSHPQSPRTKASETDVGAVAAGVSGVENENARLGGIPIPTEKNHLDGAADALRAWVRGEEERGETRGDGENDLEARTTSKPRDEEKNAPEAEKKSSPEAEGKSSSASPFVVDDSEAFGPSRASVEAFETFSLKIVHRASRTGFEAHKDFPVVPGEHVAGRYRVLDVLGAAAFSTAVKAEDVSAKNQKEAFVCLKIVKNNKDFFDQSLDEVRLLRMMNDADARDEKNIVRMLDFFYHREHLFIVTELLGLNLYEHQKLCLRQRSFARRARHIRRRSASVVSDASVSTDHSIGRSPSPPASPERSPDRSPRSSDPLEPIHAQYFTAKALRVVAKQVLVALEFMHARGVIHCDVKPENIVLRLGDEHVSRRSVKVIDLGSSCFTTDHLSSYVQSRSYRAPEVVLGAPYDGKVDLWSLGCVLAELFTGEVLLRNESTQTALARVIGIFGPLDPELLRLGKHAGALITATGVPYERRDDDETLDAEEPASEAFDEESITSDVDSGIRGWKAAEERGESRGVRVLLPKRTSLAARLGLPPLGVACDAKDTESPNRAATRTKTAPPAPTALPPGFAAKTKSAFETEPTSVSGKEDAKRKPRDAWTATEEKDGFIEFLLLLLQPNPRSRPTAAQALKHEWLAGDDDDFEDAWVPPQTAFSYGDARERDILAQL